MRKKIIVLTTACALIAAIGVGAWWWSRPDSASPPPVPSLTHSDFEGGVIAGPTDYPSAPPGWQQEEINGIGEALQTYMNAVTMEYRTDGDSEAAASSSVAALPSAVQNIPRNDWGPGSEPATWRLFASTVFAEGTELAGEPEVLHRSWQVTATPPQGDRWEYVTMTLTEVVGYRIQEPAESYMIIKRRANMAANHASSPARYYPAFDVWGETYLNLVAAEPCKFVLDGVLEPKALDQVYETEEGLAEFVKSWREIIVNPNGDAPADTTSDDAQLTLQDGARNCADGKDFYAGQPTA